MPWSYNYKTKRTDDCSGILPRARLEEAAEALIAGGFNTVIVTDVLAALSGVSRGEVAFNVELVLRERRSV